MGKPYEQTFESRPDGEYALCHSCARKGYGPDSWHPLEPSYWANYPGKTPFIQCQACYGERSGRGFRTGIVPDKFEPTRRTVALPQRHESNPHSHAAI